MGKRYKKGNRGKRRVNSNHDVFLSREREINKLIRKFGRLMKRLNVNSVRQYKYGNYLRLRIKELLRVQSDFVYRESRKRQYIYNSQVMNFKGIYVTWKKRTLPLFFKVKFRVPDSCVPMLCRFYVNLKRGGKPNFNIFY